MQPVTFLDVRAGVVQALEQAFPEMQIYGEENKEGFATPCFFVKLLEPTHSQELNRRYLRVLPFEVLYYTETDSERIAMAEQLAGVLETIRVNDRPLIGTNMSWKVEEEVLHFFVTYRMHVWKQQPDDPLMQTLQKELKA